MGLDKDGLGLGEAIELAPLPGFTPIFLLSAWAGVWKGLETASAWGARRGRQSGREDGQRLKGATEDAAGKARHEARPVQPTASSGGR